MSNNLHIQKLSAVIRYNLRTVHGKIVFVSFLVGSIFLPTWFRTVFTELLDGNSAALMNIGFLYVGIHSFWKHRQSLRKLSSESRDLFIGYAVLLVGIAWLLFCQHSTSLQAAALMLILIGVTWSSFGILFFRYFASPFLLVLLSIYPNYAFLAARTWHAVTPPFLLENLMAWLGSLALNIVGQPAIAESRWITLPAGAVVVGPRCSGFDMAFEVSACSLILGLILNQRWRRIVLAVTLAILLSLLFNIPRIMLLTLAAVYGGEQSFEFWHGPWGGQIFSVAMLTVYYYIAMAIYSQKLYSQKPKI